MSRALATWQTVRVARINHLRAARSALRTATHRQPTHALNWSLVLALASEFQGFSRELHDETTGFLASTLAAGNAAHFSVIRNSFTTRRQLDRVNAGTDTVAEDFGRFGIEIWKDIAVAVKSGKRWRQQLDKMNYARNGIAHNDLGKLQRLKSEGYPINTLTVDKWYSACNATCRQMDSVLQKHLRNLTGVRPW
jgi:hypothetical protein